MIQFAKKLVHHRKFIVFLAFILLIPSTIGIVKTRINYDILSYLPDSLETVKGQDIMVDQFGAGAYSMIIVEDMNLHDVQKLKHCFPTILRICVTASIVLSDDVVSLNIAIIIVAFLLKKTFLTFSGSISLGTLRSAMSSYQMILST